MKSDNKLLVPVHLDCLVVNDAMVQGSHGKGAGRINWVRPQADYGKLKTFDTPEPPLDHTGAAPAVGVHLHWALPDGLTRGRQKEHGVGKVEFPPVPNRWLVVRTNPTEISPPWKAWVIESDYLGSDGKSPFVDPKVGHAPNEHLDGIPPIPTKLGRIHLLHPGPKEGEGWKGDPHATARTDKGESLHRFLKAVGPGDPIFAAWQPGVDGVFGLHDDLLDLKVELEKRAAAAEKKEDEKNNLLFTYTIVGWYSDPQNDPLHNLDDENFAKRMDEFSWTLSGAPPTALPDGLLCHASRVAVKWQPIGTPERPNLEEDEWVNIDVGIGNTAIDGLAAILEARAGSTEAGAKSGAMVAELFEAAQYGLLATLDEPAAKTRLDHQIRDHWFGSHPGGIHWEVVASDRQDSKDAPAPELNSDQQKWLAGLNRAQQKIDHERRKLESMQWQLYALWWKTKKSDSWTPPRNPSQFHMGHDKAGRARTPPLDSVLTPLKKAVADQHTTVGNLQNDAPDLAKAYSRQNVADETSSDLLLEVCNLWRAANGHHLPHGLQLKPSAAPRFWHPTDPVVVVSGLERARKHGEDGRHRKDGNLVCRLASQTLTSVAEKDDTYKAAVGNAPIGTDIPDVTNLLAEVGALRSALIGGVDIEAAAIEDVEKQEKADAARAKPLGKSIKVFPSPVGITPWKQAWVPLFIDWEVAYYPTTEDGPPHSFDRDSWQLSASAGGTGTNGGAEYQFRESTGVTHPFRQNLDIEGRTFLTPQAEFRFVDQITQHIEAHPPEGLDEKVLEKFLEKLQGVDVLSQSLSGFNQRLIMRRAQATMPPGKDVAALVGDQYHSTPDPDLYNHKRPELPYFVPVRGGFFHFKKLKMVDAFGQSVDLMFANKNEIARNSKNEWPSFRPHRGRGLIPAGQGPEISDRINPKPQPHGLMVLPPRFVQPARLDFRLLDGRAEPTNVRTNVDEYGMAAGAEPVCGWLIPNHLDSALVIYDSAGYMLGELILRTVISDKNSAGEVTVDWLAAPDTENPPKDPGKIENRYLRDFVTSLMNRKIDPDTATDGAGHAFEALLEVIDSTLWAMDPLGGRSDQNLSLLIGRPLALVRSRLGLTLHGEPVGDQAWNYNTPPPTNPEVVKRFEHFRTTGVKDLKFDVKLGDPDLRNDGLMGYFEAEDFSCFHSVHPTTGGGKHPYVQPIKDGGYIKISAEETDCRVVTMLLDPRGAVHAATGLLPTKTLELPGTYVDDLLSTLRVTFRAGPILSEPDTLRMPRPVERIGTWGWLEKSGVYSFVEDPIIALGHEARLADSMPVLREGWLQLSEATPKLTYAVTTEPKVLLAGSGKKSKPVSLSITITNNSGSELECEAIDIVIPLGKEAAALAVNLKQVKKGQPTAGWKAELHGNRLSIKPPGERITKGKDGTFKLTLDGVVVNEKPGTARLFVVEKTKGRPTASLAITKAPAAGKDQPSEKAHADGQ